MFTIFKFEEMRIGLKKFEHQFQNSDIGYTNNVNNNLEQKWETEKISNTREIQLRVLSTHSQP